MKINNHFLISLVFLLLLTVTSASQADWMNLTGAETASNIAEIYVMDDHVKVVLEVYVGDLKTFAPLVPDDWVKDVVEERPGMNQRLQRFSKEIFQVVTNSGEVLPAQLLKVEPRLRVDRQSPFAGMINPMTRQRVPDAPADKRVLYAEIIYPFDGKPETLTFVPPKDDKGRATVTIGFITFHKAVPVIDFRYLGAPAILNLDWDDPWYTKFDNPNLKRHHKSALMTYLYVEPYDVRHEVLTRVRDLEAWIDLGLRGKEFIEIDELEPLKQRIGEFFLSKNPVLIDGEPREPVLDRTSYVKVSLKGIQLIEQPERLEISTAIVGIILSYITDGMPQEVTVDWELFTDQVQRVPATATDPAGPLATFLDPESSRHTWTNFLKNYTLPTVVEVVVDDTYQNIRVSLASILCAIGLVFLFFRYRNTRWGFPAMAVLAVAVVALSPFGRIGITRPAVLAPALAEEKVSAVLLSLLTNVYRAFDFKEAEHVYDKLATSVGGDLLETIYLEHRRSFAVKKAGGAQARVNDVAIQSVKVLPRTGDTLAVPVEAQWTAMGSVGHWGHVHQRKNRYHARLALSPESGHWLIEDLDLIEEERIDPSAQPVPDTKPKISSGESGRKPATDG